MADVPYLYDVLALLLAAVVIVPLLQRFSIPSVLGYLAAGMALGPHTPGPVVDVEATRPLAELGVVFLLFAIGLELPLARLKTMRRLIFGLGLLQVVVTGGALGGLGVWLGLSHQAALVVGATLAFSSTATVLAILVERNETVTHQGRVSVAILVFQDLAVVPVLALLPMLARDTHRIGAALGIAGLKALLAIGGIYLAGRLVLRPAYRYVSAVHNPEVFVAANLLLVLAVAWVTAEAGMSMALGAFLAGLLLADSPYRHQVEASIEPIRGLLMGLFFMTVGMTIDLPVVAGRAPEIVGLTLGVLAIKALVVAGLCLLWRMEPATGVQVALLVSQVGEFAFVVFERAVGLHILAAGTGQVLVGAVALSMVLTPALAALGRRYAAAKRRRLGEDLVPVGTEALQGHVVIAGYGRVGRAIARVLQENGVAYLALDLDSAEVAKAREEGRPVFYGDAGNIGVLRAVGIERAVAAVVTVNDPRTAEKTVNRIRQLAPSLPVVARAHDGRQQAILGQAGATAVVPETMEASLRMAGLVLGTAGLDAGAIERSLEGHRAGQQDGQAGG